MDSGRANGRKQKAGRQAGSSGGKSAPLAAVAAAGVDEAAQPEAPSDTLALPPVADVDQAAPAGAAAVTQEEGRSVSSGATAIEANEPIPAQPAHAEVSKVEEPPAAPPGPPPEGPPAAVITAEEPALATATAAKDLTAPSADEPQPVAEQAAEVAVEQSTAVVAPAAVASAPAETQPGQAADAPETFVPDVAMTLAGIQDAAARQQVDDAGTPAEAEAREKPLARKAPEPLQLPEDPAAPAEDASPKHGRWPKKVKAGRALLEVTEDMLERSHKLPILLHWRWTGKSINAMYLYQRNIFQGYVGAATCDVPVDVDVDASGMAIALTTGQDDDTSDRAPFVEGDAAAESTEPEANATCALCGLPESKSRCMFSDNEAKRDAGHLVRASDGSTNCWVHSKCAQFSHECAAVMRARDEESAEVSADEHLRQLHSALSTAIRSSRNKACSVCQKPHASLRCCFCSKVFHYGCAVASNCFLDSTEPYKFTCRTHASRITDVHEPDMLQLQSPMFAPQAMAGMMAGMYAAQQRAIAESNATTEMQTSSDDDGGDNEGGTENSSDPDRQGRESSAGALDMRTATHLAPDAAKFMPPALLVPGMRAAEQAMLFNNMRQMAFMDPQLRLQGPHAIGDMRMGMSAPAGEDQGEWCFDRFLGGTTGQKGRHGRCSVCLVQRKGRCGTESAPNSCIRVQAYLSQGKAVPSAPPKQSRKRVCLTHPFPEQQEREAATAKDAPKAAQPKE